MKRTAFQKWLCLVLCAVMCAGLVGTPVAHADMISPDSGAVVFGADLTAEQRSGVLNRSMNSWVFPLAEEWLDDVVDFCGCKGAGYAALYDAGNSSCTTDSHATQFYGNDGMDIRVPAGQEVYAPVDGTLYRANYPDFMSGYTLFIEQQLGDGYSYYVVLAGVSDSMPVASGSAVHAGDTIAYTSDSGLHFSAVMTGSGQGDTLAAYPTQNLMPIWDCGWLTENRGTGLICVNSSYWTSTQNNNVITGSFPGPIVYTFVAAAESPIMVIPTEPAPTEEPTEIPIMVIPTEPAPSEDPTEGPIMVIPDITEEAHTEHVWDAGIILVEPSHTAPGSILYTCTVCGETMDSALDMIADHTFDQQYPSDAYLAANANCSSPALYYYSCICGAASTETFAYGSASDNHVWDGGIITVAPSHTAGGERVYTCTVCGDSYTEFIAPSADHVFDQQVADDRYLYAAGTCTQPAYYFYSCICGEAGGDTFSLGTPAGHTFASEWSFNDTQHWHAATCTHTEEVSDLADHTWNEGSFTIQPSHTAAGEKEYTCTVCGVSRREAVPASADHVYDQQIADAQYLKSEATCTDPAVYYTSCVCGATGNTTFVSGSPLGHTYSDQWSFDDNNHWRSATCGHDATADFTAHAWNEGRYTIQPSHTTAGEKEYTCTVCGASRKEAVPASADHVYDQQIADAQYLKSKATCTDPAVYYTSCICGAVGTTTFTTEALGHTFSDQWSADDDGHWHAATCGHNAQADYASHSWDTGIITVQPTHTTNGSILYTCTVCGIQKEDAMMSLQHVFDQQIVSDEYLGIAASCDQPASYYYSCSCGQKGSELFTWGDPAGHTFSTDWSKDDTQHWHNATCMHTSERADLAAHTWNSGEITQQPTETANGVRTFTCSVCGATRTESVAPSVHTHTFSSTWTGDNNVHWQTATCEHTGEIANYGMHVWDSGVTTRNATHAVPGEIIYTCTVCGGKRAEIIPAAHVFDQKVASPAFQKRAATCVSSAEYYVSCACGEKGTDTFFFGSPNGHTFSGTWMKDGSSHYRTCTVCGARGDVQAHTYPQNGTTCSVCGAARTDGHIHTSHLTRVITKPATCTENGSNGYYTCDCGKWFSDVTATQEITDPNSVVIPALGHKDDDKNGRCDNCNVRMETLLKEYSILEGANSTWMNNSTQGLVFRASSEYSDFDHVEVDNAVVSPENYIVGAGSTIVELRASYMKHLTIGSHNISIFSKDGKAAAGFTVRQAAAAPTTKDSGGSAWLIIALIALLALLAAGGTIGYLVYTGKIGGKKGRYSR